MSIFQTFVLQYVIKHRKAYIHAFMITLFTVFVKNLFF